MKTQNGFTLLEMAIAAGIIAIMGSVIAQTFFTATKSQGKRDVISEVKQNGDFALSVMERMIRTAAGVTSSCSGASAKSITIQNKDLGTTTFDNLTVGSVVRIASVSASGTSYLTTPSVTVTSTVTNFFTCSAIGGVPRSVAISFTLSQAASGVPADQTASTAFQSTVVLRN